MDYQIGDRVVAVVDYYPGLEAGEYGTVIGFDVWDDPMIHWDEFNPERHNYDGEVPEGHGWHVNVSMIELAKEFTDLGDLQSPTEDITKFLFDT